MAGDRVCVLATRAGLSGILRRAEKAEENPAAAAAGPPATSHNSPGNGGPGNLGLPGCARQS
jgi:hypothetical protein